MQDKSELITCYISGGKPFSVRVSHILKGSQASVSDVAPISTTDTQLPTWLVNSLKISAHTELNHTRIVPLRGDDAKSLRTLQTDRRIHKVHMVKEVKEFRAKGD